jgi:hypothetical protein
MRLHVSPRAKSEADALVAELGADVAWVGQVLVYHARFATDKMIVNGQWAPPETDAFRLEPSAQPSTAEYEVQQDGQTLYVRELFYPLRASRAGKARIPGTSLVAQFAVQSGRRRPRDFFPGVFTEVRNETYASKALDVLVRDLPAEGRPADFTGLVGSFVVSRRASADRVAVGDTVTVETVVSGAGALAGFELPAVEGDAFKVYADQPVVNAAVEGGRYTATGTWKHAVVPLQPGPLTLPSLSLAVFDPGEGAYTRVDAPPITVDVTGAAADADVRTFGGPVKKDVDAIGEDILPVRTEASISRPWSPFVATLLLVPGFVLILVDSLSRLRARPRAEVARRLDFADLPGDAEGRLAGMERILRERVGDRIGVPADAVRREDLARLGDLAPEAERLWRQLEGLRYGGASAGLPEAELGALVRRLS